MNETIERYRKLGFTEEHKFPGEYVLLVNPQNLQKVRVYDDGRVWEQDPKTGEYHRN